MITDLLLLLLLFALLFGILKLVSAVSAHPSSSSSTPSTTTTSSSSSSTSSIDWQNGQLNLVTNRRPVTQQDLLERASTAGAEGGRFVGRHAESFSFGKHD
ncbi:related to MTR2-mRNA export protein [Sporisorium scitamineum]|uniref:Related to MTR2-mRNA export protein n=1 Tax=Sporisorium scitamineum TaxID=49012 RepID=A0A127Z489_9BASI|nr:related to MTR2-mRNA export protein [Sporisorium scitamineum]